MLKVIDFIKGNEVKGAIIQLEEKSFRAVTGTQSKGYKTERGARKFLEKNGYIEVEAVKIDTVGDVVEVVRLGNNLEGITEELLNTDFVVEKVKYFFDGQVDKMDLIEEINELNKFFGNNKVMVIDDIYSTDADMVTANGIKVGDMIKPVEGSYYGNPLNKRNFKDGAMVLGMFYQVYDERYVAVLDNGYELFVEGNVELLNQEPQDVTEEVTEVTTEPTTEPERIAIKSDCYGFSFDYANEVFDKYANELFNNEVMIHLKSDKKRVVKIHQLNYGQIVCNDGISDNKIYVVDGILNIIINPTEEDLEPPVKEKFNPFSVPKKDITGYEPCPKCGGSGVVTWALHNDSGVCFKCKGSGKGKKVNRG